MYGYDAANQLTSEASQSYAYDATGNKTGSGYTTTTGNRQTAGGGWTYTYDNAEQAASKSDGSTTWTYGYDQRGQLVSATTGGGQQVKYAYDAFGAQVGRTEYAAGGAVVSESHFAVDEWDTAKPIPVGIENFDAVAELLSVVADLRRQVESQQAHIHELVKLTFGPRGERVAGSTLFDDTPADDIAAIPSVEPPAVGSDRGCSPRRWSPSSSITSR